MVHFVDLWFNLFLHIYVYVTIYNGFLYVNENC